MKDHWRARWGLYSDPPVEWGKAILGMAIMLSPLLLVLLYLWLFT